MVDVPVTPQPSSSVWWWQVPSVVVIVGAAVRIWRWALGRPLWLDEQMISLNIRGRGFAGLAGDLDHDQSAPLG